MKGMMSFAKAYFDELQRVSAQIDYEVARSMAEPILRAWLKRGTVYTAGNGGSASTASHFVADLQKLTIVDGLPRLRALSLSDNIATMTAWSNDQSYFDVFVEQARNLVAPQDVVVCISGSGNSDNILRLADYSRSIGATVLGLVGYEGGKLKDKVDLPLITPSSNMQIIEDLHLAICHMLASYVRSALRRYADTSELVAVATDIVK